MDVGRPKNNDYPAYMTTDGDRGGFLVRNPVTGKKKRFPPNREAEARKAADLLGQWVEARRQKDLLDAGRPKLNDVINRFQHEQLPRMPWDTSTRQTALQRLARIKRELGKDDALIEEINCVTLGGWLSKTAQRADPFNKWLRMLIQVWGFALEQGIIPTNEAAKIQQRSISRKIPSNRKNRQQLDVAGFKAIHAQACPLLQLAMEMSLVTLQARREVCNMQHTDFRDGFLFIIRDKTAADSDMAFIKIRLTPEIESFRARARALDEVVSPYLIHRRPKRMQRRWITGKPHWTYVNGDYITELFAQARNKVPRFAELPERQRPVFHEIRGLGGRLYKQRGMSKDDIRALMTHSNKRTTEIYLERGREALTDEHFTTVAAPCTVRELLGTQGR